MQFIYAYAFKLVGFDWYLDAYGRIYLSDFFEFPDN